MSRRTRLPALVAGSALVLAALASTTPAQADPTAAVETPVDLDMCVGTPVWTGGFSEVDEGKHVTGKTTVDGTEVSEFDGTFISRLDDSFGNDVYLFKLSGSRITKADGSVDAGIWSGISGSPVYDDQGNLVGSVSYGFTNIAGSDIAGVTPAANIFATKLADEPEEAAQAQRSVPVSKAARADVVASGSKAGPALRRLPLRKVVVGASAQAGEHGYFAGKSRSLSERSTDFGTAGSAEGVHSIEAGGNIATSWTSGDLLFASVGTVTAVCGDEVYAYGHPDEDIGDSNQTIHSATTATIVANGGASYKQVNINPEAEGDLINDGTNGIYGTLGDDADRTNIPVTTTTTYGSRTRSHETSVSEPAALTTVVATQIFGETAEALGNSSGAGAGNVAWDITYLREDSTTPETFTREQFVSSPSEFGYDIVNEVAADVETLQLGSDENILVTGVEITSSLTSRYFKGLKVSGIQVKSGSTYKTVAPNSTIKVKKGAKLDYKVVLTPAGSTSRSAKRTTSNLTLSTSKSFGSTGALRAYGAKADEEFYDDEEFYFEDEDEDYYEALSFPELLAVLGTSMPYNQVVSQLTNSSRGSKPVVGAARITDPAAVISGSKSYKMSFTR